MIQLEYPKQNPKHKAILIIGLSILTISYFALKILMTYGNL